MDNYAKDTGLAWARREQQLLPYGEPIAKWDLTGRVGNCNLARALPSYRRMVITSLPGSRSGAEASGDGERRTVPRARAPCSKRAPRWEVRG
jgi:hypothetical protein